VIVAALVLSLAVSPPTVQAPQPPSDSIFVCPVEVAAGWGVTSVPNGWRSATSTRPGRYALRGATFTYGHPDGSAYLKPSAARTQGAGAGAVRMVDYRFEPLAEGVWLVCAYHDTPAILYRRLAGRPTRCEVTYPPDSAASPSRRVKCSWR
jgi:hypothetical protein